MFSKTELIELITNLPDNFSFDELLDQILLLEKVELGLEQAKNGQTYSTEEAARKLQKWLS